MICPGIVVLFGYFIPESPRWLVAKGQREKARVFLVKHHANGEENHPIVALELKEIEESLKKGGIRAARDYFNLKALIKSRPRRYRIGVVVAWSWFMQFSGNNVSSYYLPYMVKEVGITSVPTAQLLNGIYAITGWIAASIGGKVTLRLVAPHICMAIWLTIQNLAARCHDVVGRRKMFLGSTLGMVICMAVMSGTTAKYQSDGSKVAGSALVSFIFIFGVVFAVGYTAMQPVYSPEILASTFSIQLVL